MKFGILGTGVIGSYHARAIQAMKGSELVGVANRSKERALEFARQHNTQAFDSIESLLDGSDIDIVTIGTASGAHFEPAMSAIEAGKHVVVEKPLEITTERIDTMIRAAKEKGVVLAAILNRRYHPSMTAFKKSVDEGRFGRLTSASAYVKWYRDQAYYDSAEWRGTWSLDGGGALMNQSIHAIDALLHLAGPVQSVQANTACLAHDSIEVEDIAIALLEFKNGARGVIEGSTCTWSKKGHPARIQLAGTEGSVFLADEAFEVWDFMEESNEDERIRSEFVQKNAAGLGANDPKAIDFLQHQRNFEEVVAAIQAGREPKTNANEARASVALIEAIYQSARENGQKIPLDS
ncbi:MAG: Gfo/Idh/MocA family protein [Coraliomargaritaceae bacterium]